MVREMIDKLPEWFRGTPAGREAIAELQSGAQTERERHVGEIQQLRAELHETLPGIDAQVATAQAEADEARELAAQAETRLQEVRRQRATTVGRLEHAIAVHRQALARTADPAIDGFIREMQAAIMDRRRRTPLYQREVVGYGAGGRLVERLAATNAPARAEFLEAAHAAIAMAEELRFAPQTDVGEQLEALRASLPDPTRLDPVAA